MDQKRKMETREKVDDNQKMESRLTVDYHSPFYHPLKVIWRCLVAVLACLFTYWLMKFMIRRFDHSGQRPKLVISSCIVYTLIVVPIGGCLVWSILLECRDSYVALRNCWMIQETHPMMTTTGSVAQKEPPVADMV